MAPVVEVPNVLELRKSALELGGKVGELRSIPRDKRTPEQVEEMKAATAELVSIDAEATAAENYERRLHGEIRAWLDAVEAEAADKRPDSRGPGAAFDRLDGGFRSFAQAVTDRDEYTTWAEGGGERSMPELIMEGRSLAAEYRTLLDTTGDGTTGTGPSYLMTVATPRPPVPREMQFFLRDLLSVVQTNLHAVPYVRELNPATTESGASSVAESAVKPEGAATFELDTAIVQVLAVWIPATMQILQDAPTLQGYINNRLAYMVQVREQQQVLTGNGVTPDLKGILQYATIQTAGATNADPATDIASACGKVENVDLTPNGIAMNPIDYWTTVALRHSTLMDGGWGNGNAPFAGPAGTIWGLPVVRTRALTTLTAVVADWMRGATLFDRMQTTIRQSDSHDTYFIYNKVAILAEERVGLAVERPDAFVKVTIDITP